MAAVEEAEAHWVIAVSLCGQASIRKALDGSGANARSKAGATAKSAMMSCGHDDARFCAQ